jgi:hypothetical protein
VIKLDFDMRATERALNSLERKQLPFATALAINEVLGMVKAREPQELERELDNPTPFTKRGLFQVRANKRKLHGVVGFKDGTANYLKLLATGGKRLPSKRALLMPVNQRVNKYGNMPRGSVARVLQKPNVFSGKVKGVAGVWLRPKRGTQRRGGVGAKGNQKAPKLLIAFRSSAQYRRQLHFEARGTRLIKREIGPATTKSLKAAIRSAK